jgi:membrane-bound serine protease (ClpP class)
MKRQKSTQVASFWLTRLWLFALLIASQVSAQEAGGVKLAVFKGPVTPVLASYLDRTIAAAEASGASAVILELDTPGGSVDITKEITQRMQSSTVPVIVYVAPSGAHAGSAGTFITLAGHAAAMAPGSSIGAASPVGSEGADLPDTLKAKATNILVADIKNLAARRGEQAEAWAAKAVSEAAAATADEALELGVVDAIAQDVPDLLRKLDGKTITVGGKPVRLQLAGQPGEEVPLNPLEGFLNAITNPAIAAILLTIGLNAILFELSNPGGWVAGVIGAVCLLLALYALGTLQANWTGLGFVVLAFVLFVLDIKAPTHGVLTLAGVATFIFGSYLLFNTPEMTVPWGTIIGLGAATGAFFAFIIAKALLAQRLRPSTGIEAMIGELAVVRRTLDPVGMVHVEGELWRARSESGALAVGARVVVTGYDGMLLHVRRPEQGQGNDS